jgi:anti-anti-sigma factor
MLNVQRKNLGNVSLLNLNGNVLIGETDSLREIMQTLPSATAVILDFSRVALVDAHGLGVLLQVREQAQTRGMHLELTNVGTHLRELFRMTRLDSVLQIRSRVFPLPIMARGTRVAA